MTTLRAARMPVMALGLAIFAGGAEAQTDRVSSMNRQSLFQSQLNVLEGRAADQYRNSDRLQPDRAEPLIASAPSSAAIPNYNGRYRGQFLNMARSAARRNGIPEDLFLRLVQQESGWNPNAVSHAGAIGLAQLMPGTARRLGVNPRDPAQNLDGGARYLRQQFNTFGNWRLALAAYNAGPGAVQQYGGIPPYRETQNYVRAILGG